MGVCGSSLTPEQKAQAAMNKEIEKQQRGNANQEDQKIKLLLLGAGESGKSTIFKQMKVLYGTGMSEEERHMMTPVVYSNVLTSMKTLIDAAKELGHVDQVKDKGAMEMVENAQDDTVINGEMGDAIKSLWADPGIQMTWEDRSKFQIIDSVVGYFDKIDEIKQDDYLCDTADILLARVRTSGIVEESYNIDGVTFVMYDVGGQRNERKKWIHCFEDVTAVIFVAAISEYNQMLYEDSSQNRMDEALELFNEIANSKWFNNSSMILFLNKRDLLHEKVLKFPIKGSKYPDFAFDGVGGSAEADHETYYNEAVNYFRGKFLALNKREAMYDHVTCATDTANVQVVFNACKEIILKGNLAASGFMD